MEHPPVTGRKNARVDGLRIMTLTKQSFQACQLLFLMDCQMIKKNSTCVSINLYMTTYTVAPVLESVYCGLFFMSRSLTLLIIISC